MAKATTWGGRRDGAGRKPIARELVRSQRVTVKLTPAELSALASAAGGAPLATWVRGVALRAAKRKGTR